MKTPEFKVENRKDYVWRCQLGGEFHWHNWIPSWYVVETATGKVVAGGCVKGSNISSGHAYLSRRKDAKMVVRGIEEARKGNVPLSSWKGRPSVDEWKTEEKFADLFKSKKRFEDIDNGLLNAFLEGAEWALKNKEEA